MSVSPEHAFAPAARGRGHRSAMSLQQDVKQTHSRMVNATRAVMQNRCVAKMAKGHFVIVPVSGKRVLVLQNAAQEILAVDAKCTHEGCTVQYLPGESAIWCACHNARFDLDGRVLAGPPPRPLPKYAAERQEDGGILIVAERRQSE